MNEKSEYRVKLDLECGGLEGFENQDGEIVGRGDMWMWRRKVRRWMGFILVLMFLGWNGVSNIPLRSLFTSVSQSPSTLDSFLTCSTTSYLATNLTWLSNVTPLPLSEFVSRRDRLAQALFDSGIDAFIVEPGYTFQYYVNVSQFDWEPWEPEERPFLLVVEPVVVSKDVDGREVREENVRARVRFLAPKFEEERVRLLNMPFEGGGEKVEIVTWEEHWDPFGTLLDHWDYGHDSSREKRRPKVMVDDEMRDFIQRGLATTGLEVVGLQGAVENVKQIKSPREIDILRAVNTGTLEAIRAMRSCMVPGSTETEIMNVLDETLRAGGLEPFFDIVLFDEDASNPHGGTDGVRVLVGETLVLIDVGAHLHGYSSDITRTFFPPFFSPPNPSSTPPKIHKKLQIYNLVHAAQTASLTCLTPNNTAASVDIAARDVITAAGYGDAFTHRVGHGIGIKAHESPYLNKGNNGTRLKEGMAFTSEPGVYLPGEFGVRIEDVLLVRGEGVEPEVLSGRRAGGAWDP